MAYDAGVAVSEDGTEQANMGLALGDYLNVGRMSLVVTHFSDEYAAMYRNDGGMTFSDVSALRNLACQVRPMSAGEMRFWISITRAGRI